LQNKYLCNDTANAYQQYPSVGRTINYIEDKMKQSTFYTSKENVFDAILKAANSLELVINEKSMTDGIIKLEHVGSFLSFGNKIEVELLFAYNKCVVKVSSRSAAALQIIDWGTNEQLESKIIESLKEILGR